MTLRATASDVNTIELINYLKSLGRSLANKKIEDLLMAGLLSLAKQHSGEYTSEQLRLSCLESCNALSFHSSYLRQVFGVPQPGINPYLGTNNASEWVNGNGNGVGTIHHSGGHANESPDLVKSASFPVTEVIDPESESIPSELTERGNLSDLDAAFGD